jgi:hypothetical protein
MAVFGLESEIETVTGAVEMAPAGLMVGVAAGGKGEYVAATAPKNTL